MKFVADAMLGRLARWLRLLGFDVLYCRDIEDRELVRISRAEGRTLLTRDTRLAGSKGLDAPILLRSDDVREQLVQLADRLDPATAAPSGRCDVCNSVLEEVIERDQVRDRVPEHIYRTCTAFTRCPICGRVYWPGTHYRSFRQGVAGILRGRREN